MNDAKGTFVKLKLWERAEAGLDTFTLKQKEEHVIPKITDATSWGFEGWLVLLHETMTWALSRKAAIVKVAWQALLPGPRRF